MALTPIAPLSSGLVQVLQSDSPPGVPPADPAQAAIYYIVDALGNTTGVYFWGVVSGTWNQIPLIPADGNYSEGLVCGWEGPHNVDHLMPVHAEVAIQCMLSPRFSVSSVSSSPIPFELHDLSGASSPSLLATGVFPAGAKFADATQCSLVDPIGVPVGAFGFAPGPTSPVAHYVVVPAGGHGAMPADGETFMCHFAQQY